MNQLTHLTNSYFSFAYFEERPHRLGPDDDVQT